MDDHMVFLVVACPCPHSDSAHATAHVVRLAAEGDAGTARRMLSAQAGASTVDSHGFDGAVVLDAKLSRREVAVAQLVRRAMTNREIADALFLSPHTVNYHLRQIFRKLSISSRVLLAPLAQGVPRGRLQPSPTDP